MNDQEFVVVMAMLLSSVGLLLGVIVGPIGRAIGRRIDSKSGGDPTQRQLLEDISARLEDLMELRRDVIDLQERVDFAERVLAQQREEPAPLPRQQLS